MSTDPEYTGAFDSPADAAFDRSEQYFFQGEPLEAFSGRRRRIAERLGLRFFAVLSGADFERFVEEQTYPGFSDDMVLVLWLCSQSKERCARARRYRDQALEAADDWADERGIFPGGDGHQEACEVFTKIVADVLASISTPDDAEGEGDGPGKSPATGRSTSSPSHPRQDLMSNGAPGTSPSLAATNTSPATSSATAKQ